MSFPAHADSVVNCSPVSCMPSPESPANRITARSRSLRTFWTPAAGAAVSLIQTAPFEPLRSSHAHAPRDREVAGGSPRSPGEHSHAIGPPDKGQDLLRG